MANQAGQPVIRAFDNSYLSVNDAIVSPQYWDKWVSKYGSMLGIFDTLRIIGNIDRIPLKGRKLTTFYDVNVERPIILGAEVASTGTSTFTFTLDAGDYDDDGNTHVQVGQSFFIDKEFISDSVVGNKTIAQAMIRSVSGTAPNLTFTAEFLSDTTTLTTAIPTGTKLIVGGFPSGTGTGQPKGLVGSSNQYEFYTSLLKRTLEIEGGAGAIETLRDVIEVPADMSRTGKSGLMNKHLIETEFRFEADIDKQLMIGELNTAGLTQERAPVLGGSSAILSGDGMLPSLDKYGSKLGRSGNPDLDTLRASKDIFIANGILSQNVAMLMGSSAASGLENGTIDWIKDYSGGSSFMNEYGDVSTRFGVYELDGLRFHKRVIPSWSNPQTYGVKNNAASGYAFPDLMIMFPFGNETTVTVGENPFKMDNVELLHLNNNGDNRSRIIGDIYGMNGMGMPIQNQYDAGTKNMLSEFMLVLTKLNQAILSVKD